MQKIHLQFEPKIQSKLEGFRYQLDAFSAIKDLEYSAIFHEQGLGKTKIAIDLALYWLKERVVDTILIVVKKGLVKNWEEELAQHNYIKPVIFDQDTRKKYYAFNTPTRLALAHYEVIKKEESRFKLYMKSRNIGIILDESTKIKNPDSDIAKVFFNLSHFCTRRVIMSGTPIANRPQDIWAQINFLDFGSSLGKDFKEFKRTLEMSISLSKNKKAQIDFEKELISIWPKISNFSVRETKRRSEIELPDKKFITINSEWEPRQLDLYNTVREDLKTVVVKNGIPREDNSEAVLKRLLRLVQIASNPRLIDEGYKGIPGKLSDLEELIEEIVSRQEKCIVWTSFTENADFLASYFSKFGTCKIHGKLANETRNKAIEIFKSNSEARVLVATPGAAKEGLTLTMANHAIFYDRGFSLDDYLQAQDRIHRISQKKTCFIYKLLMENSIDQWVDLLLQSKHLAAMLGQGDVDLNLFSEEFSYDFFEMLNEVLGITS